MFFQLHYFCMAIPDATILFSLSILAAAICDDDNATSTGRHQPKSRSNTFFVSCPYMAFRWLAQHYTVAKAVEFQD